MKRTLALLLALALILSCGAITTAVADDLPQATVKMWVFGPGDQADTEMVKEQLNKLIAEKLPNTTLDMSFVSSSGYQEKFDKAMAANERIDIAWAGWMFNKDKMAQEGTILPMDDLLEQYGQGIVDALGKECIDLHRAPDGKIYYAVSWQGLMGGRNGLYLPLELVNEMPEGWEQELQDAYYRIDDGNYTDEDYQKLVDTFELYPKTLQEKGKLYNGVYVDCLLSLYIGSQKKGASGSYGYVEFGDDTFTVKPKYVAEDDGFLRYAKLVSDYYQKGYIQSDIASANQSIQWNGELTATDYIFNQHSALDDGIAQRLSAQYNMPITVVYFNRACTWDKGSATAMVLPYTSKEPERAMMVLNEFYANPELYQDFVYGLKDVHWTDNGDGTITTLGGAGQATSDWPYGQWKWIMGTCMNALVTQADTAGYYEGLKAQEATAYASPLLNFSFNADPVATEASNLSAVYGEYWPMFYKGYLGDELETRYNEFVDKMNAAGLETYNAEYQRQITEFVTANNSKW